MEPLAIVSSEVEAYQKKFYLTSICIKAQQKIFHKLQIEARRRTEICNFIRNSNLQLQKEILYAEHDIKSKLTTCETIRSANVDLKKELLLTTQNNLEVVERMKTMEQKYDELWLQSRKRYESIPFVQEWLQTVKKVETLKENGNALENEAKILRKDIEIKKKVLQESDRKQIVRMAEYIVSERPQSLILIKEKSAQISELTKDIDIFVKAQKPKTNKLLSDVSPSLTKSKLLPPEEINITNAGVGKYPNNGQESNDMLIMPKLQLANMEVDFLSVKLELNKVVNMEAIPIQRTDYAIEFERNETKMNDDYTTSSYFTKPTAGINADDRKENNDNCYSKMKLINILEDIRLDDNETYNIVSKVNPVKLQEVNIISADGSNIMDKPETTKAKTALSSMECEEIEEIDLSAVTTENLIMPPTQFADLSQEHGLKSKQQGAEIVVDLCMDPATVARQYNLPQIKSSQENVTKKVSFDLPLSVQEIVDDEIGKESEQSIGNETNDTINSHAEDLPPVNDDGENYLSMILKKHHLPPSPEFVYAKHTGLLQRRNGEDEVITSRFFDPAKQSAETMVAEQENDKIIKDKPIDENLTVDMEMDDAVTVPKVSAMEYKPQVEGRARNTNPVTGLLFTHGPNGIPESLDLSMSTNDFEEGDGYYPHCLDSSLLLSPKADLQPMAGNGKPGKGGSEDMPNFFSGFRKTGLFFFGQSAPAEDNPDSSAAAQNQENNFNFNFGEKKNKGGLFSFFR